MRLGDRVGYQSPYRPGAWPAVIVACNADGSYAIDVVISGMGALDSKRRHRDTRAVDDRPLLEPECAAPGVRPPAAGARLLTQGLARTHRRARASMASKVAERGLGPSAVFDIGRGIFVEWTGGYRPARSPDASRFHRPDCPEAFGGKS
jgi:hypothetical protein